MISKLARCAVFVLACWAAVGCSNGPRRAAPVESDKALAALRTALDAWKAGQKIESLGQSTPPIVAQDFDWMAGAKLTEYKLLSDGTPEDANLRVQAQITVRDAQGRAATKTVTYIVGTDPKLTVFRAME
ncbi:hypothetical protein J8F10_14635 [Gemmata sp. G18]|uniref:Lipoprotein n=1 Tax=Gemmata palustris TaxID=2822762 RepID=A0ABS5BS43_9BACT|nr:hypothetical protein [Gemmata palustris]MBP3956513.1 hypothetical protein [Gemmata palustris]